MRGHVTAPCGSRVALHTSFCVTFTAIALARCANLSVPIVSSMFFSSARKVVTIADRELPPSESWSSRVSFELRHGTWPTSPLASRSITVPSA